MNITCTLNAWMNSDCRITGRPCTSINISFSVHVFAQNVARAASYIHTLSHTGIRMTACMKLSVCFSFVNVFTSASLNGVVLMGNFSGFHALNTIKNQCSAQKDVRVTPEAPTEISLSALAGVSHLVLLFKCKYQNEAVIFQRTVSLVVSLLG